MSKLHARMDDCHFCVIDSHENKPFFEVRNILALSSRDFLLPDTAVLKAERSV